MISERMQELFNRLIQLEYSSAYLYLAMSNYFHEINLTGMAHWLRKQYDEERGHALKLNDYLIERGGVAEARTIPEQPSDFDGPLAAWEGVLRHEQYVTRNYKQAYRIAERSDDPQSLPILLDFLREQVEEEGQVAVIVGRLRIVEDNSAGLILIDQELSRRS